jgi:hypothetical protein
VKLNTTRRQEFTDWQVRYCQMLWTDDLN